ncbi:MAG: hypothetical protein R3B70_47790 [Polyangiaceae bacterium]
MSESASFSGRDPADKMPAETRMCERRKWREARTEPSAPSEEEMSVKQLLLRAGQRAFGLAAACAAAIVGGCLVEPSSAPPIERESEDLGEAEQALGQDGSWDSLSNLALELFDTPGPYGFATRDFEFVDASRPTPPNGSYPGSPVRALPTHVFYPAQPRSLMASPPGESPVPVAPGKFPILGYAHGLSSTGNPSRFMCEFLATHGYICVAPRFPLTNAHAPGGPTFADVPNQPADLAYVMDQIPALGGADADLAAAVNTQKRGILGLSMGGLTVILGAYHPTLQIPNLQAAVAEEPSACFLGAGTFERSLPVLLFGGTADEIAVYSGVEKAFSLAPPPVTLIELIGGTHVGFLNQEVPFVDNNDTPECERLVALQTPGFGAMLGGIIDGVGPGTIDPATCGPFCADRFPQTMGASRELKIARAATRAHFDAALRNSPAAKAFLGQSLGGQPDVNVHSKP